MHAHICDAARRYGPPGSSEPGGPKGPPSAPPAIPPIIINPLNPFSQHVPEPSIDPIRLPVRPPVAPPGRPGMYLVRG